jgi:hypothetical protein|tara:strand:+ start:134 stop:517 length:384 start_codon:yes stop_codon:yes gene_type:complete
MIIPHLTKQEHKMTLENFFKQLANTPESIEFKQVMDLIEQYYEYSPASFRNGPELYNEAGTNEGSCKIFAFAQLEGLSQNETLACFGKFYREEVLEQPDANNHGNIRAFIKFGWNGIQFDGIALVKR